MNPRSILTLPLLSLLALAAGCQATGPVITAPPLPPTGEHIVVARSLVGEARKAVAILVPKVEAAISEALQVVQAQLADADANLDLAHQENRQVTERVAQLETVAVKQATTLESYKHRWTGDLFQTWLKRILIGAGLVLAAGAGLTAFGLTGPGVVQTTAAYAGRTLLMLVPVIGHGIQWLADHSWLKRVTGSLLGSASPAAAPAAAPQPPAEPAAFKGQ